MTVIKRDGSVESYDSSKIENAIRKAFIASKEKAGDDEIMSLVKAVEGKIEGKGSAEVEFIQDNVEEALMKAGFFQTAKRYILFRKQRTVLRDERKSLLDVLNEDGIEEVLIKIQKEFPSQEYSLKILENKFRSFFKEGMSEKEKLDAIIKASVELTKPEVPKWEMIAARFLSYRVKKEMRESLERRKISSFSEKVRYLADEGLYGEYIVKGYTKEELEEAAEFIDEEREDLFTYSGLELLIKRYVIKSHQGEVLETPEEMFLGIALHLALPQLLLARASCCFPSCPSCISSCFFISSTSAGTFSLGAST